MELELHDTDEGLTVIGLDGQTVANGDLWHASQAKYVIQAGEVMPEFRFLEVALLAAGASTFG